MITGYWVDSVLGMVGRKRRREYGSHGGELQYVSTSAGELRCYDSGGAGPALIITPDGPCTIEHMRDWIRTLTPQFRVVCFDMPGQGFSFPSLGYRFTIEETGEAVIELMDALRIRRAALVFTCVNGLFAMNVAKRDPGRISHLVLGQTPSLSGMLKWKQDNIPAPLTVPVIGQLIGALSSRTLAHKWFGLSLPRGSELIPSFRQQASTSLRHGGCFCLSSLVQGTGGSLDEDTQGVDCPVLMIYGNRDFSHRNTEFRCLHDTIPHAELVCYEGCGHFPNLERPDLFSRDLKDFVGRL